MSFMYPLGPGHSWIYKHRILELKIDFLFAFLAIIPGLIWGETDSRAKR